MSIIAFILIVASATLHVTWNTIAKKSHMSVPLYTVLCTISCALWLHVLFWTPVKITSLSPKVFLLMLCSVLCDSMMYCHGLIYAYRYLDMSTAYPVMRALPILITAVVTSLLGIGTPLSNIAMAGMVVVFLGCLQMPLSSYRDASLKNYANKGMLFVVVAALGTTGYTIFDSMTMHALREEVHGISNTMVSVTFYSLRECVLSTLLLIMSFSTRENRRIMRELICRHEWQVIFAAVCASATYMLVLCAMLHVSNVSYVQVCRQLGLPIGMLASVLILKERWRTIRVVGCLFILCGLVLTFFSDDIARLFEQLTGAVRAE